MYHASMPAPILGAAHAMFGVIYAMSNARCHVRAITGATCATAGAIHAMPVPCVQHQGLPMPCQRPHMLSRVPTYHLRCQPCHARCYMGHSMGPGVIWPIPWAQVFHARHAGVTCADARCHPCNTRCSMKTGRINDHDLWTLLPTLH